MATNILMPALSPTMTEGTLARWLKKEGEAIKAGDVIAEIETDKATMEVEAVDEGVLGKILVADGTEGVAVNAPIAILIEQGEPVPATATGAAVSAPTATPSAPGAGGQGSRTGAGGRSRTHRRPRDRVAVGQAHGAAGRRRPVEAHRQRPERPYRQGRCRGGTAEWRQAGSQWSPRPPRRLRHLLRHRPRRPRRPPSPRRTPRWRTRRCAR